MTSIAEEMVRQSLERVNLGTPRSLSDLTVWPLLGPDIPVKSYWLLDPAIRRRACEVREAREEVVDSVVVANDADEPIFALHGQLLRGAKQNRAINLTTMFPARSETNVHVACVERGRWTEGKVFADASWIQSAAGRSEKLGTVLDDLDRNGAGRANQDRVWCQQAIKSRRLQVQASTLDEIEIQEQGLGAAMTAIVDQWTAEEDQIGAILCANNSWAIEVFDQANTYAGYHTSLLKSFALEASEARSCGIAPARTSPRILLDKIWSSAWQVAETPGAGTLLASSRDTTKRCALIWENACVSVSASGFQNQV